MVRWRHALLWCLCLVCTVTLRAQRDTCTTCVLPCARTAGETFTVRPTAGRPDPAPSFGGITRDVTWIGGEAVQTLRLTWNDAGRCRDTMVQVDHIDHLVLGRTLGKVPPYHVRVLPVAEYARSVEPSRPLSYAEVGPWAGYVGPDESVAPQVGIPSVMFGAEALVAPFGDLLGDRLSLALGAGLWSEGGRMRIPALAHLRYSFGSPSVRSVSRYIPGPCTFGCEGARADTAVPPADAVRRPGPDSVDPTAYLLHDREVIVPERALYLFVEGGPVFDGAFEGSGPRPSLNPDDYAQYTASGGIGLPITSWLHGQLAYRYARLNLRTPCVDCGNIYQVNTNVIHAAMLRVMIHWGW